MRRALYGIAAVLLLWLGLGHALAPVPSPTGYLTDQVGIVEPTEIARIQVMLGRYEVATGRRLSVLLVASTPDEPLESFADRVLETWGLADREPGGALLLWSGEGYVLIRPAGATAQQLDEAVQNQILAQWVVPAFARGEAGVGLRQGVEQMIAVLDGGSVAPAPAAAAETMTADDGAAAGDGGISETLELDAGDATAAAEAPAPADDAAPASVSFDGLPPWIGTLPGDLRRLAAPFSRDLDAGVMGWLREAGREADQLPVLLSGLLLQMRGERVEPAFPGLSEFAVYAWGLSLGLALLVLLPRRAFVPAVCIAALDTGFFLWLATGFVALSGVLVLLALLAPVLVPLVRSILRGADDGERDDPPPVAWPVSPKPVRPPVRVTTGRTTGASTAGSSSLHKAPTARTERPAAVVSPAARPARARVDALLDDLGRIAFAEARRLRWVHAGVLLVLVIVSFPLAVLVVLGTVAVTVYRSGAAYLIADALVKETRVREQLKQQLPRPSPDVVPGA
jgi:hypothetical protein